MKSHPAPTGRVVFFGEPGYHEARLDFNLRFSKYPLAVVFCRRVADVINAILWARENGLPIRARSGRHSYEAFSLVDGGIIIDASGLNRITVGRDKSTVRIGAGARLLPLYRRRSPISSGWRSSAGPCSAGPRAITSISRTS